MAETLTALCHAGDSIGRSLPESLRCAAMRVSAQRCRSAVVRFVKLSHWFPRSKPRSKLSLRDELIRSKPLDPLEALHHRRSSR